MIQSKPCDGLFYDVLDGNVSLLGSTAKNTIEIKRYAPCKVGRNFLIVGDFANVLVEEEQKGIVDQIVAVGFLDLM
jgi:hypothetical protein